MTHPASDPVVAALRNGRELAWLRTRPAGQRGASALHPDGIVDAENRFTAFGPWFEDVFGVPDGVVESPLEPVPNLHDRLNDLTGVTVTGRVLAKRDDVLPISGSVKSRGGIHEVLQVAEEVAAARGVRLEDALAEPGTFADHGIVVGSTGNLGLAIGVVSAALGFRTTVHMSRDAKAWKKELLRSRGVEVVEHPGDFTDAVSAGRRQCADDPTLHFVDDENSTALFYGYAAAGRHLARQLRDREIPVDDAHPLIAYLPCGVGGAPSGLTYGLRHALGPGVRSVFAEPVAAPSMTLAVRTGLLDQIAVRDIGLDGRTTADGLAVGRASSLAAPYAAAAVDGFLTLTDARLNVLVAEACQTEGLTLEASATAGLSGPWLVTASPARPDAWRLPDADLARATHVVWFTGGALLPDVEHRALVADGRRAAVDWDVRAVAFPR
ncbi:D-serine ammonia-lyase [Nigerium massiliense]|uniref:D-serine ammonia-lyase n=1 Tax=Nigerium massiliense TaxID=1522317 RepID=UPI0006945250|nr:D-serine ammonia-lyase [Nigerium massiliense]